jgi:hypothetical protein
MTASQADLDSVIAGDVRAAQTGGQGRGVIGDDQVARTE